MSAFKYVREYYGVPAAIGRLVVVGGKPGIIAEDRGHYIGVNFDKDRAGVVRNCHPTSEVVYGEMGEVRKPSRHAARYQRFLEYGECFSNFLDFCYWDAEPARSWNRGY
jgi:hypothetical protein